MSRMRTASHTVRVLIGVSLIALALASSAGAKPLEFSQFSIQTTAATVEKAVGKGYYEFAGIPYSPPFTQAGGHPWAITTTIGFVTELNNRGNLETTRDVKDIVVGLPPGLLGNPTAVPSCSLTIVTSGTEQCPPDTQVGYYLIHFLGEEKELLAPIVNVTPEAGQSAEFALENTTKIITPILTAHLVRTPQGYGLAIFSKEIPVTNLRSVETIFWGVPADRSHDAMRGMICRRTSREPALACEGGGHTANIAPVPFLSMPTNCAAGPEMATIRADSWQEPGSVGVNGAYSGYIEASAPFPSESSGVTGCDLLRFAPSIETQPDTLLADEPAGLDVNVSVPQPEQPAINVTPPLRDAVVTLPEGMSISPAVVDGIEACDAFGPQGINMSGPESEEIGEDGEWHLAAGHCPDASIVGTAEATTPLLAEPVKGHVYLARPGCGGLGEGACTERDALDGNLYRMYLELGGTGSLAKAGVEIKVEGAIEANPATGQLTATYLGNPQTPFSELRIHLNGGPRAPIANPPRCGPAVTKSDFTPWSAPGVTPQGLLVSGTPDATPSSYFEVEGCLNPSPFSPSALAGTMSPQAGQFSQFTLNLSRHDREQFVRGVQLHAPPGLLGVLANVPLCEGSAADLGTCPEASKIGNARVASGAGSHPFEIEGDVYLTGPHAGAPFGLSIVTRAVAGPFDLGLVVVRARIDIDRHDSTLIVTTDEFGPHAIPQILFGVPLRLQRIAVDIDRPHFMFNPTHCGRSHVDVRVLGSEGALVATGSPFAAAKCSNLAFKPKFAVSTSGQTSRAKGASLDARLSYPVGAMGKDANMARVKVSLPRQLPSRLSTLQRACLSVIFDRDPAACPVASIVGVAKAKTPLLPVGLAGPVYFVSHGGEAFPSLIVVLQGDGVRVDLNGTTFISKAGITSSTFKALPDVPVGSFELYLPQGAHSALAANGNLCSSHRKLVMPTEFVAQDGQTIKVRTHIAVIGCKGGRHR
jgi:hypothetical protein